MGFTMPRLLYGKEEKHLKKFSNKNTRRRARRNLYRVAEKVAMVWKNTYNLQESTDNYQRNFNN